VILLRSLQSLASQRIAARSWLCGSTRAIQDRCGVGDADPLQLRGGRADDRQVAGG
jgi:hypothetical protein